MESKLGIYCSIITTKVTTSIHKHNLKHTAEVNGGVLKESGESVLKLLEDESNYPVSLRFGVQKITSNEKIILASTFHTVFAFACQVSPLPLIVDVYLV